MQRRVYTWITVQYNNIKNKYYNIIYVSCACASIPTYIIDLIIYYTSYNTVSIYLFII